MSTLRNLFSLSVTSRHKRSCAIEGVRGVAILLVFLCHYADIVVPQLKLNSNWQAPLSGLAQLGRSGVALFFVLSGYLIYRTVVGPVFQLWAFWGRRLLRIYPAFLAVFSIYLAMWLLHLGSDKTGEPVSTRIPGDPKAACIYLLENIFFLPGIFAIKPLMNVAWSLSYEWFFYLLIPLPAILLQRLQKPSRLLLLSVISGLFLLASFYKVPFIASHNGIIMFVAGMIVYELMQGSERAAKFSALACCLIVTLLASYAFFQLPATAFFAYAMLLYYAVSQNNYVTRLLSFEPLRALGNISYSFYLIHGLPIHLSASFAHRLSNTLPVHGAAAALLLLPLCLGFTTVLSLLLYNGIERPLSLSPAFGIKPVNKAPSASALPGYVQ